jgi:hypothetical protein
VNVHDWHRNGLRPAFATVEQWIHDQLGYVGAEDEACFAIELRPESSRAGLAVRVLIASDKGLFDLVWERPNAVSERHVSSTLYRWPDVSGLRLLSRTDLDPRTLIHLEPQWGIEISTPALAIERVEEGIALLEFWKACDRELKKAVKG